MKYVREAAAIALGAFWLSLALLAPGCSSGGSDEVMAPRGPRLAFDPLAAPTLQTVAARPGAGSTADRVAIDLVLTAVDDVFGTGFTVEYDESIATYDSIDVSVSHLGFDGVSLETLITDNPGSLEIGITRLQSAVGVDFSSSELLARLYFARVATAGAADLTFENELLQDSDTPPQPIGGVDWFGGVLEVN